MKPLLQKFLPLLLALLGTGTLRAVEDTRITVQGTNVVLSWPSVGYEYFVVQYRTNLDLLTPWTTLTNNMLAKANTNRTSFTHTGAATFIPCTGGGGGSSGGPPVPSSSSSLAGGDSTPSSLATASSLRVAGIDGPVEATTELAAYYDGPAPLVRRGVSRRTKPEEPPLPFGPGEMVRQRQRRGLDAGGEVALLSSSLPTCGLATGFYRVFLVPDFWYDYSGYTFSDSPEFLPVFLGVDESEVSQAVLLVDGQASNLAEFALEQVDFGEPGQPDVQWTYGFWFYHDQVANGSHQLAVRTLLNPSGTLSETGTDVTLTAPAITASVNDPIKFTDWGSVIVGGSHTFKATTTVFPASYTIELYDHTGENLVVSTSGNTSNGQINWTWNLLDWQGQPRNSLTFDPCFYPVVTVTPTGGQGGGGQGAGAQTRVGPTSALDYPDLGLWVVSYQDSNKHLPEPTQPIMQAVQGVGGAVTLNNVGAQFHFLKYGTDVDPDPVAAQAQRNQSWQTLSAQLFNLENRSFYYAGHGNSNVIGGDFDLLGTNGTPVGARINRGSNLVSKAFLTSKWVRDNLTFNKYAGPRPYRFAFLDGCSTAAGDWPDAFGMGKATNSLAFYQNANRRPKTRPCAFVGWNVKTFYSHPINTTWEGWGDYQKFADFRTWWITEWTQRNQTLLGSLATARQRSAWITQSRFEETLRVFGYQLLRWNEYNHRADW